MSKHTPGPWMIESSNSWRRIGTGSGVGSVCCPITQNDGHPDLHFRNGGPDGPDARLIAAAPALLEALEEIVDYRGGADNALEDEYVMERVCAAIAAAKGDA